ncbi:MAG: winged helix-turn-helix transcriptional regulator [Nitrosarchaeum sp.]|nr:winged helix-turn-helix transcriptional regulator [Nitrosarchaeum sp.]MCV0400327.1 winged helix-turn-helix transcriptional regulator [Nitrosarchaeum sp.]
MTDRNLQLQQIIKQNPGIQFREIMRTSGLKNGVLSHYLGKLEKNGIIKVERGQRQTRFFSPEITENESKVIKALRRQTPRDLLLALMRNDGLDFSQLVDEVGKSPSTISLYLSQIVADGLVKIKLEDLKKRYYIQEKDMVDKLLEDYKPSPLEKSTSEFEDIINSF